MSLASRGTRAAARCLKQTRTSRQPRRYASETHGHDHAHGHGHGESALHLKDANPGGNESMGAGFYWTLAAVPVFYVGYNLAYGSEDNFIARLFLQYKAGKKATADADALHMAVMSQAIADRTRLSSYPREVAGPDLKYPEFFNAGSPYNLAVGHSGANMKKLEEHYRTVQAQVEDERIERLKQGGGRSPVFG